MSIATLTDKSRGPNIADNNITYDHISSKRALNNILPLLPILLMAGSSNMSLLFFVESKKCIAAPRSKHNALDIRIGRIVV